MKKLIITIARIIAIALILWAAISLIDICSHNMPTSSQYGEFFSWNLINMIGGMI